MNEPSTQMPPPPKEYRQDSYQQRPAAGVNLSDSRRKSPFLACVLSAMPGLGQIYVGYYQRGFIHAIAVAVAVTLLVSDMGPLTPLFAIALAFFWLYNIVDAGRRAALYNYALDGGTPIELPDDFKFGGLRGSVAGGATLVAIGLVLLANTRFGLSLDWIEDWWPMAIVAFGGFLVYRAIQEKSSAE